MRIFLSVICALIAFVFFACSDNSKRQNMDKYVKEVTAEEAGRLLKQNKDIITLDKRPKSEFNDRHIKKHHKKNNNLEHFENRLKQLDKSKPYLLYCRSGNRSGKSLDKMIKLGFTNIYHLTRGYNEWKELNKAGAVKSP